jgi:nicotinate-nucleotide adenylyltransferase
MNIALFGTSGDPPTTGHQKILEWLGDRYDLVAVWVSNNPFKSHQTPLQHREEMMRLLIGEVKPKIELHPEISNSRTLITVNQARQIWINAEFTLVVGSDLVAQLPSWYQAQELLAQVKVLVIMRVGYAVSEQSLGQLSKLGANWAIAEDLVIPEISSSNYRHNGDRSNIIPAVQTYIHTYNLYR